MSLLISSGDKGIRTLDPLLAKQVLSQLSYTPALFAFRVSLSLMLFEDLALRKAFKIEQY